MLIFPYIIKKFVKACCDTPFAGYYFNYNLICWCMQPVLNTETKWSIMF